MKLTTVLASVNSNSNYYTFIPFQIKIWKHFGIRFLVIYASDKIPEELLEYHDNIILWDKNSNLNSAYLGQNLRMYYAALLNLPKDEMVMITDMDMLPTCEDYYKNGLEEFNQEDFVYYRYIYQYEEKREIFMCYNAAHPSTWAKVFNIHSEADVENTLQEKYRDDYDGIHGGKHWTTDQEIMYEKLINYTHFKILNRNTKRLDMDDLYTRLERGERNFIKNYHDVHFHRSYFNHRDVILKIMDEILLEEK